MFLCTICNNRILNTKLNNYCRDVMKDAIKRIEDKYYLERTQKDVSRRDCMGIVTIPEKPYKKDGSFTLFMGFLSISTMLYYLYNKFRREQ